MAMVTLTLSVETELVHDAADLLERIDRALAKRHGEAFRALDRRLDALAESGNLVAPEMVDLEPGRFVMVPSDELKSIIAEAKKLGVI
jgi:N-acetylglucosamine kinase-like BadF-type ATPase